MKTERKGGREEGGREKERERVGRKREIGEGEGERGRERREGEGRREESSRHIHPLFDFGLVHEEGIEKCHVVRQHCDLQLMLGL